MRPASGRDRSRGGTRRAPGNCASCAVPGPAGTRTSNPSATATISIPGYRAATRPTACSQRRREACAPPRGSTQSRRRKPVCGPCSIPHAGFGAGDRRAVGIAAAGRLGEIPPRGEVGIDSAGAGRTARRFAAYASTSSSTRARRSAGKSASPVTRAKSARGTGVDHRRAATSSRSRDRRSRRASRRIAGPGPRGAWECRRGRHPGRGRRSTTAGRRSGTPFTTFSRWCTLASLMAGRRRPSRTRRRCSARPPGGWRCSHVLAWRPVIISMTRAPPLSTWRTSGRAGGAREPGLVGQHVERGVVKPAREGHLAVVPAGQDHDVAGPIVQELAERIVARADDRLPRRWTLGPAIEGLDQRQELGELSAATGPSEASRTPTIWSRTSGWRSRSVERGVEMPGVEEHQRVHRE